MDRSEIVVRLREHEQEIREAGIEHLSLHGSWARGTAMEEQSDVFLNGQNGNPSLSFKKLKAAIKKVALRDHLHGVSPDQSSG